MRNEDLIELAGNPNFISGIHNYCDRWCERCPFTARCVVYATEQADPDNDPDSRDINNAAFWKKLASIFADTQQMISVLAKEKGINLSPKALAPIQEQKHKQRRQARNHPLAKAAEEYAHAVAQWFERDFPRMEVVIDVAADSNRELEADDDYVNDYVEVIRWYQFFIAAKLVRGLTSRVDEADYLADEVLRDSDGSAKAALIAIDRSLSAWQLMSESRRENVDSIQKLLLDLQKLRLSAEREFPCARDFIRPGFDEPSLDMLH